MRSYSHDDQQLSNRISSHDQNSGFREVLVKLTHSNNSIRKEKETGSYEYLPKRGSVAFTKPVTGSAEHAHNDQNVHYDRDFQYSQVWIDQVENKGS